MDAEEFSISAFIGKEKRDRYLGFLTPKRRDKLRAMLAHDTEGHLAAASKKAILMQLGTDRQGNREAREWGATGKPVKDINFTDHGKKNHTNPHQHRWDDKGKRLGPEPLKP